VAKRVKEGGAGERGDMGGEEGTQVYKVQLWVQVQVHRCGMIQLSVYAARGVQCCMSGGMCL